MSQISELINSRISANTYDSSRKLAHDEIVELIQLATRAPSAFNMQNWRFIAVFTDEAKARLLPMAYGQQKVVDAAVTFIVCGTLNEHLTVRAALKPSFDAGILDSATFDGWASAAENMYRDNVTLQRDEAIRSGALAGATLMLAAQGRGLASTPMIGFDPAAVAAGFGLSATEIPVMMITVGYAGAGNWPQKPRKPVADVLTVI